VDIDWAEIKNFLNKNENINEIFDIYDEVVNKGELIADEYLTMAREFLSEVD